MRRVAVRGIATHESKLLCVRQKPYTEMTRTGGEWWCLPGGTVEDGEALEAALIREMFEETAVQPILGRLLYIHQFMFKESEQLEFFFHITNASDYVEIDLNKASHGSEEIEKIEFVDPRTTIILPKFLTEEPIEGHIQAEAPVKFFSFIK